MLRRCKDVYITLCMDAVKAEDTLLFDNIRDEAEKLKRVCAENSVPVAKSVVCLAAEDRKRRTLQSFVMFRVGLTINQIAQRIKSFLRD